MMKKTLCALALIGAAATSHAGSTEGFGNTSLLQAQGWTFNNASTPAGIVPGWFQGDVTVFTAQSGADNSYIAANYNNAAAGGTLDNSFMTALFSGHLYDHLSFWARAADDPMYSDSLSFGLVDAAGNALGAVQTFTVPTDGWHQYTLNFSGIGETTMARLAIHYTGAADSSNYVGIDSFALPEPTTPLMLGIGALGLIAARRRKQR